MNKLFFIFLFSLTLGFVSSSAHSATMNLQYDYNIGGFSLDRLKNLDIVDASFEISLVANTIINEDNYLDYANTHPGFLRGSYYEEWQEDGITYIQDDKTYWYWINPYYYNPEEWGLHPYYHSGEIDPPLITLSQATINSIIWTDLDFKVYGGNILYEHWLHFPGFGQMPEEIIVEDIENMIVTKKMYEYAFMYSPPYIKGEANITDILTNMIYNSNSIDLEFETFDYYLLEHANIQVTYVTPEPGTVLLLGLGLSGIAFAYRRTKNKNV